MAARQKVVAQPLEVLDDAVMDDRDLAGAVGVRMGVHVVGPAVRRPAGVGQAYRGRWCAILKKSRSQVLELAGALLDEHLAAGRDQGDAGRVVAAVLKPGEALQQDGRRLARPNVADDSTHSSLFPSAP